MFAAVLGQIGQDVALDPLADPDQKAAWHARAQKLIRSLYGENSCGKEEVFQPNNFQNSPLLNAAAWITNKNLSKFKSSLNFLGIRYSIIRHLVFGDWAGVGYISKWIV